MINIKINMKVVCLSILISLLMYPKTISFLIENGKNIYIAKKLSNDVIEINKEIIDYDKTKIVFIFDDGWKTVYSEGYKIMNKYNHKGTISVIPSRVDEREYMTYEELSDLYLSGWDLLNHSYSHKEDNYDNTDELFSDFNKGRQWMNNRYIGRCNDMVVMPYGEINPYLITKLKDAKYHSVRTSDNIIILEDNMKYYPITTINLLTDLRVNEVKDILTQRTSESKTIIFILHKIGEGNDGYGMIYSKKKLEEIIIFIDEHKDKFEVTTYSQLF